MTELEKVKAERDALKAHVERLKYVARESQGWNWLTAQEYSEENGLDYYDIREMQELAEALDETPDTSMTRIKAQWQAEALEKMLGVNDAGIEKMMMELRRQAEERSND